MGGDLMAQQWDVPGYTEVKVLGSGGFGEVVLARHDASGTRVAIKYLHRQLLADPGFAAMFRGEAEVLASVADPNVVRLYEYVQSPSGAAIVMELVEGVCLREILARQGKTTAEAALVVLQGSLLGLAAAHARGVVHRDYKPENVLIDGAGASKLTDFGIAARAGDSPRPAGTLAYAPPEQFGGGPATPSGDVYAATATFYECLTGRPPFTGDSMERLLYQHLTEPVPLEPVPEPLRPLLAAGLAKDPAGRPADAAALVSELRTVASRAYGPDWEDRGRSLLGEAALLLAALWPSGAPPAVQGATVHRVRLRRHIRPRHISPVKAIAAGVAVVAAGTALAVVSLRSSPAANTPALTGTWTGSYICSQGLTGLRLVLRAARDGTLTGTFNFYALPTNPGVPSGDYTVTGTYSATRTDINPGHWIKQPSGYVLVDLIAGPPTNNGTLLRGRISNAGCSTFSITKSLWR
jgi:eukaryotic-like serine/threonine-protein kinase